MILHQAIYGVVESRGHGLIQASGNLPLAQAIAYKVDLPDTVPTGVECPSYLTGFLHQETHYVLARVTVDRGATRAGMVFSHAIFIPAEEIGKIADLRPLINLLTFSRKEAMQSKVEPVEVDLNDLTTAPYINSSHVVGVTNALVSGGELPVICCGNFDFDNLMVSLWGMLWPALRLRFAFRLTFSPRDLELDDRLSVALSPPQLVSRWGAYQVIQDVTSSHATSLASELLRGAASAEPLRQFMQDIALVDVDSFKKLRLLTYAYEHSRAGERKLERVSSAIRIIGEQIAPSPNIGVNLKANLLTEFVATFESELTPESLFLLRNLKMDAFPSKKVLWEAVSSWVAHQEFSPNQDEGILDNLREAFSSPHRGTDWSRAVIAGVLFALENPNQFMYRAIWRWLEKDLPCATNIIEATGTKVPEFETELAKAVPKALSKEASEAALMIARQHSWWVLHGAALACSVSPQEAVKRQLQVDKSVSDNSGVLEALKHASDQETLSAALEFDDSRLIAIAVEIVVKTPALLADHDLKQPSTQRLWARALEIDSEAWKVSTPPWVAVFEFMDAQVENGCNNLNLVGLLSSTPAADLCRYPDRAKVWTCIPDPLVRERYLVATSSSWLELASSGTPPFVPDPVLQRSILGARLESLLSALSAAQFADSIAIVQALPSMQEDIAVRWIEGLCRKTHAINQSDASALGILIRSRKWKRVLSVLVRECKDGHSALKHALVECYDLLPIWDTFRFQLKPISDTDVWKALTDAAIELYPQGPDQGALWERAEGKNSDLEQVGSGAERWQSAIRKMKYGNRAKPHRLLEEMLIDYRHNDKLNWLDAHKFKLR